MSRFLKIVSVVSVIAGPWLCMIGLFGAYFASAYPPSWVGVALGWMALAGLVMGYAPGLIIAAWRRLGLSRPPLRAASTAMARPHRT